MTPERWRQVTDVFHAALLRDIAERGPYLEVVCADDRGLRDEVEAMLAAHGDAAGSDTWPAISGAAEHVRRVDADAADSPLDVSIAARQRGYSDFETTGAARAARDVRQIGPYRLLEKIGEGGMGEVWLAEQRRPVHRHVAVKIIKAGMDTGEFIARFEAERQALAMMNHPGIARMIDGGSTSEDRPYFVMEYVPGAPITAYCDQVRLSISARLELFLRVCAAVQHAHQKAVIHRDLKPSNVLIVSEEQRALPKIIDFGVAKATAQRLTEKTMFTRLGVVIGTPEYMSPEQADPTGQDVDTRTDVYALGVMLYELLTGVHPVEVRDARLDEIWKRIREEEPMKPSIRVTKLGAASGQGAERRRTNVSSWRRELSGDLDWITMKALEKDRTRRYGSTSDLAADVERHLTHQPVLASPPSATYRARRFVQRHRLGVGMAAACTALLAAAVVVSVWMALRASRAEQVARAVNEFLQNDLLAQASATNQPNPNLTVRTALDRAADRIEGKFGSAPAVEASIRYTVGSTYSEIGQYSEAQRQLERSLKLRRQVLGAAHPDTLDAMYTLGVVHHRQGSYAQAESLVAAVVQARTAALGDKHPKTLLAISLLASLYERRGDFANAERMHQATLAIRRAILGDDHPETGESMNNLAYLYRREGRYEQAEALYEKLVEMIRRTRGDEYPDTMIVRRGLGSVYLLQGKHTKAEPLFQEVLDVSRRVLGDKHPDTLVITHELALVYRNEGRYSEAEALFRSTLDAQRVVIGSEHVNTLFTMHNLATLYRDTGRYGQADELYMKALRGRRQTLGEEHPDTLSTLNAMAQMFASKGHDAEAEVLFGNVLRSRRRILGDHNADTLNTETWLSRIKIRQRRYSEAEAMLRKALESYEAIKRDAWSRYDCQSLLGASLAGQGKYSEAEPLLLAGYAGLKSRETTIAAGNRYVLEEAEASIVRLYHDWGKPEKATEWKQRAETTNRGERSK